MEKTICDECKSVLVNTDISLVCPCCGLEYESDNKYDTNRDFSSNCCEPINKFAIGSKIGAKTERSAKYNRLNFLNNSNTLLSHKYKCINVIYHACKTLEITDNHMQLIIDYYRKILTTEKIEKGHILALGYTCIYYQCKICNLGISINDIINNAKEQMHKFTFSMNKLIMIKYAKYFKLQNQNIDIMDVFERMFNKIIENNDVIQLYKKVNPNSSFNEYVKRLKFNTQKILNILNTSCKPTTLIISACYKADSINRNSHNEHKVFTMDLLGKIFNVNPASLRTRYYDIIDIRLANILRKCEV